VRIVDAQHHRTFGTQLVDVIERRLTRIPAGGRAGQEWASQELANQELASQELASQELASQELGGQELGGDGERIISPALLARHVKHLRSAGRDGGQNVPDQKGLADACRALDDDAYPGRRLPLDHSEYQVVYGPRHCGTIGRR
jgi:hypothetical protein